MRFRLLPLGLLLLPFASGGAGADEPTYAERLGWPAGARVLILHVDDAGMSYDSNLGTIEALEDGVANSFSVMMPCPWVPAIVKYIRAHPDVDAGLHLTLTSEWDDYRWGPLAGKPAVPGLVDAEGCLWDSAQEVVENATADEVEREIRAQIDRARSMGFEPTHMDSHMGTLFRSPEFIERYVKVGIETGIPILFVGGNPLVARWERRVWEGGLPVLDAVHTESYAWKSREKSAEFVAAIENLRPGITCLLVHCTRPTEVFPMISTSGELRLGDLLAMLDPRVARAIEEEGVELTTWRELKARRDRVGKTGDGAR